MNEVEKMYSNAGVKKEVIPCPARYYGYDCTRNNWDDEDCSCDIEGYPPFTAEKQLELIKWLMNNPKDFFSWTIQQQGKDIKYAFYVGYEYGGSRFLEFTEALADILNDLWQDLTDADKVQIKEILSE